jgi:Transcriptional regulator, AbiEi antitoxin, Type IV TA system/Transcriptional regulator, AbiEi antitoxin N-terminal domain
MLTLVNFNAIMSSMTRNNIRKINHFLIKAPAGVVLTTTWLEEQGISTKLAWWYVHSGLLERLGTKAYKKAQDHVTWLGAVTALQNQLQLPIHVGGKTALQLLGLAHFIPMSQQQVSLFTAPKISIPSWVKTNPWNLTIDIYKTALFTEAPANSLIQRSIDGIMIQIATPERAAMELIHLYPSHESLDEIRHLVENLGQLRPTVMQQLLEACNSIKVKRVLLYLCEEYNHPWLKDLNLNKINLGTGKLVLAGGGKYSTKYKLSLPGSKEIE